MKLYQHTFAVTGDEPYAGPLYEYLVGSNGVFIRARRNGIEAQMAIAPALQDLRGLALLHEEINLDYPRVPLTLVEEMLALSRAACEPEPLEILFFLRHEDDGWKLTVPTQQQTAVSVLPTDQSPRSDYALATIEVHSHHEMPARFSTIDDGSETRFRLYAVLGEIFTKPAIRLRLGIFGYFFEMPARTIFDLPDTMEDDSDDDWKRFVPPDTMLVDVAD